MTIALIARLACGLLLPIFSAFAKPTVPAAYYYEELMPNYTSTLKLKSSSPCPAGEKAVLISEEWTKDIEVKNIRKGGKTKIRDRNFLVRQTCEAVVSKTLPSPGPAPKATVTEAVELVFAYENRTKQVQHVHVTFLDGLALVEDVSDKISDSPSTKKPGA
jgi:hypothetical protein